MQGEEISNYIYEFIYKTKENVSVNYMQLLMESIRNNVALALLLWFAGLTMIGVIAVYGIIAYRGFILGYSIASIIACLGIKSGSLFILSSLLLQNIIIIPCVFALSISRYKTIQINNER